jgi:hypothetical protein
VTAALAAVFSSARRIARDIDYATTIDRRVFEVVLMLTRVSRAWFLGLPELMGEVRLYVGHSLSMMLYTQVSRSVPLRDTWC